MSYNKHINTFSTETDYDNYINGALAEAPNIAYVTSGDTIHYASILPNQYTLYGTYNPASYTGETFTFGTPEITAHCDSDKGIFYCTSADTAGITLTALSFSYKNYITSIRKWKIDTSNVTSMINTFNHTNLTYIDLTGFNTQNATLMGGSHSVAHGMFNSDQNLSYINLSSFDTTKVTDIGHMFNSVGNYTSTVTLILGSGFFNSTTLTTYNFSDLSKWTDAESLATLVEVIPNISSTKTISLSTNTKNALTTDQKSAIQAKGWTIA